jgi:Ca2+-binding EF-hand superfamily protein
LSVKLFQIYDNGKKGYLTNSDITKIMTDIY